MIRYGLACAAGHAFDGWFRSSGDFDDQAARRLVVCPACGSHDVAKALMAPAVASVRRREAAEDTPATAPQSTDVTLVDERSKLRRMLKEFRDELKKNSEDVGDRFPQVARSMHAEEIAPRAIHGRATAEDARALVEEGVAVQPLPAFPDDLN